MFMGQRGRITLLPLLLLLLLHLLPLALWRRGAVVVARTRGPSAQDPIRETFVAGASVAEKRPRPWGWGRGRWRWGSGRRRALTTNHTREAVVDGGFPRVRARVIPRLLWVWRLVVLLNVWWKRIQSGGIQPDRNIEKEHDWQYWWRTKNEEWLWDEVGLGSDRLCLCLLLVCSRVINVLQDRYIVIFEVWSGSCIAIYETWSDILRRLQLINIPKSAQPGYSNCSMSFVRTHSEMLALTCMTIEAARKSSRRSALSADSYYHDSLSYSPMKHCHGQTSAEGRLRSTLTVQPPPKNADM